MDGYETAVRTILTPKFYRQLLAACQDKGLNELECLQMAQASLISAVVFSQLGGTSLSEMIDIAVCAALVQKKYGYAEARYKDAEAFIQGLTDDAAD